MHLWFCGVRWASAILWTCTERRKLPPAKQKIEFKFSLQQWQNHDGTSIVRSLTMTQNQREVFWRCIKDDDHGKQPCRRALGRDQWVCGWHTRAHPSAPETSLLLLIFIRDMCHPGWQERITFQNQNISWKSSNSRQRYSSRKDSICLSFCTFCWNLKASKQSKRLRLFYPHILLSD